MKGKFALAGLVLFLVIALVPPTNGTAGTAESAAPAPPPSYFYRFEQMHEPWLPHSSDLSPGYAISIAHGENGCPELQGSGHAQMAFSVTNEAPVTWLVAAFSASGADMVTASWWAKAFKTETGSCANCQLLSYIGNTMPWSASQFNPMKETLGYEWRPYTMQSAVKNDGVVYVALGVRDPAGNFALVNDVIGVDCAAITVTPLR